jgi:hypothetical protein
MAIQRITKAAAPTGGAKIKIVSGPNKDQDYIKLADTAFDPSVEGETRRIDETTGFFGKTIAQINE